MYISSPAVLRILLPKSKLSLETEEAARDNNLSWTLKPHHQPFIAPYLTDNRSVFVPETWGGAVLGSWKDWSEVYVSKTSSSGGYFQIINAVWAKQVFRTSADRKRMPNVD